MSYPPQPGHHAPPGYPYPPPYPPPRRSGGRVWLFLTPLLLALLVLAFTAFVVPGFLLSKLREAEDNANAYSPTRAESVANDVHEAFVAHDPARALSALCSDDDEESKDDIRAIVALKKASVTKGLAQHSPERFKMAMTMNVRSSGSSVDVEVTVSGAGGTYCADSVRLPD